MQIHPFTRSSDFLLFIHAFSLARIIYYRTVKENKMQNLSPCRLYVRLQLVIKQKKANKMSESSTFTDDVNCFTFRTISVQIQLFFFSLFLRTGNKKWKYVVIWWHHASPIYFTAQWFPSIYSQTLGLELYLELHTIHVLYSLKLYKNRIDVNYLLGSKFW